VALRPVHRVALQAALRPVPQAARQSDPAIFEVKS
jgi:hypothetical protein